MKDLVISARRLRRETWWLLVCLASAALANAYAIFVYRTPWSELGSQLHLVLAVGLALWLVSAVSRLWLAAGNTIVRRFAWRPNSTRLLGEGGAGIPLRQGRIAEQAARGRSPQLDGPAQRTARGDDLVQHRR